MKVRDIMTVQVITVGPDASYKDAIEALVTHGISGVPVVDRDGFLVGIVTEADLVAKQAYPGRRARALALLADIVAGHAHHWVAKAQGERARDVMTVTVATCEPDEDVRVVARRMIVSGVKRMPVVSDGNLIGIVSRADILQLFNRPDEEIRDDVERLLAHNLNMPDEHHVLAEIKDGFVTLTGDVRYSWDIAVVRDLVRAVPGVIDVVDELHAREPDPKSLQPAPWI